MVSRTSRGLVLCGLLAACGGNGGTAPADASGVDAPACGEEPLVVFLNAGGGTFTPGPSNSSTNVSAFVSATEVIPANASTVDWAALESCVAEKFLPFNVQLTRTDPGAAAHREIVFAADPTDLGQPAGAAGVAPFDCFDGTTDPGPRAVAFVFTEAPAVVGNAEELCRVTVQIIGNSMGLDYAYHCPDVMSYLGGCGAKSFVEEDVPCGEDAERPCICGETQNSYQHVAALAGLACS